MEANAIKTVRVLKRLKAAVGYHELGMKQHALQCLDGLCRWARSGRLDWLQTFSVTNFPTSGMSPPKKRSIWSPACCRRRLAARSK